MFGQKILFSLLAHLFVAPSYAGDKETSNLARCHFSVSERAKLFGKRSRDFENTVIKMKQDDFEGNKAKRKQATQDYKTLLQQSIEGARLYTFHELNGGLGRVLEPKELNGKWVIGQEFKDKSIVTYQGEIVETKLVSKEPLEYEFVVENASGKTKVPYSVSTDRWSRREVESLYFLGADASGEDVFRGALVASNFVANVSKAFGEPVTAGDFDVAIAATNLFLTLPAGHGVTSVADTLRGTGNSSAAKKQPEFGMVAGDKRYGAKKIVTFVRALSAFLTSQNQMEYRSPDAEDDEERAPEWVTHRVVSNHGKLVIDYLAEHKPEGETSEASEPEKPKTKPRTSKEFNEEAIRVLEKTPLYARARELRGIVGLYYKNTNLTLRGGSLRRESTKKNAKKGTTTITFRFTDAELEMEKDEQPERGRSSEYFVAAAELVFDLTTAKVTEAPKFFWYRVDWPFSGKEGILETIPAPELDPDYKGDIDPKPFVREVADDVKEIRRRTLEVEKLHIKEIAENAKAYARALADREGSGSIGHRGDVESLELARTKKIAGSKTLETYVLHGYGLVVDDKVHFLEVDVTRNSNGELEDGVELRWETKKEEKRR